MMLRSTDSRTEGVSSVMESSAKGEEKARIEASPCLCVDLDGTLVQTDTLIESLLALLRARPLAIFRVLTWLFLGKARFKQKVGQMVRLQPDSLPYAGAVLDYIHAESKKGRKLLLVTAADSSIAIPVAEHIGIFAQVICTKGEENVSGKAKLAAIRRALGSEEFSYAGNSRSDLSVWKGARSAVVVGASASVRKAVERSGIAIEKVFPRHKFSLSAVFKSMRVYQWIKNGLVLMPIALGHHLLERATVIRGVRGFLAFSLCASAIYVINDLWDLPTDRQHARKRHRPLAAGLL